MFRKFFYFKFSVIKRLDRIQGHRENKAHYENVLFDYWKNYGEFTDQERIDVAKNFIEKVRNDSNNKALGLHKKIIVAEKNFDAAKNIYLFGLGN
jgi:hypothetical protein